MINIETDTSKPAVTLTPAAIAQVKRLKQKQGNDDLALRIAVKGGGCSGLSYVMSLEEEDRPNDLVYDVDGLKLLIDRKSARFLAGTTLDYSIQNLLEGGWKWSNPNAARSCGCGTSFTPK